MLNQVESLKSGVLAASGTDTKWPHHRWVRVDSKSQPPYKFHPCFNPCVPNEWPYDLEAQFGTEDWDDVIAWFLTRHPEVSGDDVLRFAEELVKCSRGRQLSVEVSRDPEYATLSLWFKLWGFNENESGLDSPEVKAMERVWFAVPSLCHLISAVGLDVGYGTFENRRLARGQ